MGIQVLFLLTVFAIVFFGFLFLQWVGGEKQKPTILAGRDREEDGVIESSDDDRPNSG